MTRIGETMAGNKLTFVDIGARSGLQSSAEHHADRLHLVLFEPEQTEAHALTARYGSTATVIACALGHIDTEIDLYLTKNPTCTSGLPTNQYLLQNYGIKDHFAPAGNVKVACRRYDTLHRDGEVPAPDIVKIDVQGFEYQVLLGLGALLQDAFIIQLETHFDQLYINQWLITDLVKFLRLFDFSLRRLGNERSPRIEASVGEDVHFDGDLVEADAIFTKNRAWLHRQTPECQGRFREACSIMNISSY